MDKIKIRIIGIGNCTSVLVQGIESYRASNKGGLFRLNLAGYHISYIQVVAAVDISENKVGKSIPEAIKANELDVVVDFHKDFNVLVVMGDILIMIMGSLNGLLSSLGFWSSFIE